MNVYLWKSNTILDKVGLLNTDGIITLKCELILTPMQMELFEYIEIWYNKIRRHSALKNMTIAEFWKLNKKSA